MLLGELKGRGRALAARAVERSLLARLGLDPNWITVTGFLLHLPVAWLLLEGRFRAAGILFLLVSGFDALDGALARATGRSTSFGAFLDSTLDRYAEALIFLSLAWTLWVRGELLWALFTLVALVGGLLTSYVRARAEGLGIGAEVGWVTRPERVLLLTAGLLFSPLLLPWILGALAALTHLTVVQRVWHVRRILRSPSP